MPPRIASLVADEVRRQAIYAVTGQIESAQGPQRATLWWDLSGLENRDQVGFRDDTDI